MMMAREIGFSDNKTMLLFKVWRSQWQALPDLNSRLTVVVNQGIGTQMGCEKILTKK
jgi:hypothetical protein